MLVAKAAMMQPEVMILETPEEWNGQREIRVEPMGAPVKVKLEGS